MRICILQHVPFEGPAALVTYFASRGHEMRICKLWSDLVPPVGSFDALVILGGPMSVHQSEEYPFLIAERLLLERALEHNRLILGICLGAQLVADVLGARVFKSKHLEVGWWPVKFVQSPGGMLSLPDEFTVFHWHGDTFDLPKGSYRIASSNACENQAFQFGSNVLAMQFHVEATLTSVQDLIKHCGQNIKTEKYVQNPSHILKESPLFLRGLDESFRDDLLDSFFGTRRDALRGSE